MSTHRFDDRRSFLRGLAATGALLPAVAYGQAATDMGPERNQSSFRTRHWRDFYPTEIWAKVGDACSGGGLKLAETVSELNPLDDFRQAVLAIEFAPFPLR